MPCSAMRNISPTHQENGLCGSNTSKWVYVIKRQIFPCRPRLFLACRNVSEWSRVITVISQGSGLRRNNKGGCCVSLWWPRGTAAACKGVSHRFRPRDRGDGTCVLQSGEPTRNKEQIVKWFMGEVRLYIDLQRHRCLSTFLIKRRTLNIDLESGYGCLDAVCIFVGGWIESSGWK